MRSRLIVISLAFVFASFSFLLFGDESIGQEQSVTQMTENGGIQPTIELTEEIDITLTGKPGMQISVNHSFGDVDVRRGTNDKITIKGEKRVSADDKKDAEEFIKNMQLIIDEKSNRVEIKTEYPKDKEYINSFSISYTLEIPENIDLNIENSFGDIDLNTLTGIFNVSNSFGLLNAAGLEGEIQLNNKFGELIADNLTGNPRINNRHGSLIISNVYGDLIASSGFGEIKVTDVTGRTRIDGRHGSMTVERVVGLNNNLINQFGSVTCREIKGNLYIENKHASVEAVETSGYVTVNNSFGSVTVTNAAGGVSVNNEHAAITVSGVLIDAVEERTINLGTSFGRIELTLPGDVSANVTASTTYGEIRSDFDLNIEKISSNKRNLSDVIGSGKHNIELRGEYTTIHIKKK